MDLLRSLIYKEDKRVLAHLSQEYPCVYNKYGEKMEMFYFKDQIMDPYSNSRYFLWDRCNYGLDTHFYSHNNMLYTYGKPLRKYGLLIESKGIVPDHYRLFERFKGLEKEFDAVFTYDADILNKLENAKFFPGTSSVWYGKRENEFAWDDECYKRKDKGISIVSSNKRMCRLHDLRINLSRYCKRNNLADTFGTFDGGPMCRIDDSLTKYRYSFAIENEISDYFFTEKITNCFASQTIPIYLGAGKIDEFFNIDGIIVIHERDLEHIEKVLKKCTREYYNEHIDAIIDNYHRVFQYRNVFDWLYEQYFMRNTPAEDGGKGIESYSECIRIPGTGR